MLQLHVVPHQPQVHPHHQLLHQIHVAPLNGLVTIIVMMKITMKLVVGMVVTVVEIMSTPNIAKSANVWTLMEVDPPLQHLLQLLHPLLHHHLLLLHHPLPHLEIVVSVPSNCIKHDA